MKRAIGLLGGLCVLAGCGATPTDEPTENLGEETAAVSFINTYWRAGTANPRVANCFTGDVVIGTAFDGNVAMVKCATLPRSMSHNAFNGTSTLFGVNPACPGGSDAVIGFSENLMSGATSITCAPYVGFTWAGNYVDGPGTGTWGQEWFTRAGHQVFGHVCQRAGYVVRAYNIDSDLFVCGT